MKSFISVFFVLPSAMLILASCSKGKASHSVNNDVPLVQIERLGRPAINEGLVLSNANLNAFNSITPASDLNSSNTAVAAVLNEASAVLGVVYNLGINAGLTPPLVSDVVSQFLPDVLRISVDDAHYGALHTVTANGDRTSNSKQNEVAYTACVSLTAGSPLLCGGRKIRDDVIDITLSYLANGAASAAPEAGTPNNIPVYPVSDAISYSSSHSGSPLLTTFPFLGLPL